MAQVEPKAKAVQPEKAQEPKPDISIFAKFQQLDDLVAERLAKCFDSLAKLEKDTAAADRTIGEKLAHLEKENALLRQAISELENNEGQDWQPEGFAPVTIVTSVDQHGKTIGKANAVFADANAAAEAVRSGSIFIETGCFAVFKQAWKLLPPVEQEPEG